MAISKRQKELLEKTRMLEQIEKLADFGTWSYNIKNDELKWSDGTFRIHEMDPKKDSQPNLEQAIEFYVENDRTRIKRNLLNAIQKQKDFKIHSKIVTAEGNLRFTRAYGSINCKDKGEPETIFGVF